MHKKCILKMPGEEANLSVTSSHFPLSFQGLICFFSTFHRHSTPISEVLWKPSTHSTRFPPSAENNSHVLGNLSWADNSYLQVEWRHLPVADIFKSLLLWTTGMIRKQLFLIRYNHNWQVCKKTGFVHVGLCVQHTNICLLWFVVER